MRERTWKLVITFHNTMSALTMERRCGETGTPGRLIPVPREISASCGMAWCVPAEERPKLEELANTQNIPTAGWYEMLL